jgi:hypothetical protein
MKKKRPRIAKPVMKWQTGDYSSTQTFTFDLPQQFLMICKLADVTPQEILIDFMDNLSCGSWKREGRENVRRLLVEYFIEHGYGRRQYSIEELKKLFGELDALSLLFPKDAQPEILDAYASWRDKHHEYWLEKWARNS